MLYESGTKQKKEFVLNLINTGEHICYKRFLIDTSFLNQFYNNRISFYNICVEYLGYGETPLNCTSEICPLRKDKNNDI